MAIAIIGFCHIIIDKPKIFIMNLEIEFMNYIMKINKKFIDSLPDHTMVGLPESTNKEEEKLNLLTVYWKYIKKPKTYHWEIEIVIIAHFLGINMNIVVNKKFNYKSYLYYKNILDNKETINILYINSNNYRLLIILPLPKYKQP